MSKKSKNRARRATPTKTHIPVHASRAEELWEPIMMAWSFLTTAGLIALSGYISVLLLNFDAFLVAKGAPLIALYSYRFLEVIAGLVETAAIAKVISKHFPAQSLTGLISKLKAVFSHRS